MYMGDLSKDNIVWNKKRLLYSSVPSNRPQVVGNLPANAGDAGASSLMGRKMRRAVKRWLNHLTGQFFWACVYLWPDLSLLFPQETCFRALLSDACASLHQDGLQHRAVWAAWHHLLWGGATSFLSSQESFCACAVFLDLLTSEVVTFSL